jgi:alpha-N-arabinofuranosidase
VNIHWGGVTEDNSFGTHEFIEFCELLGCEPVICGNVGSCTVREMAEWVEYLTSDALSPITRLRKANGRDNPWKVKFWGVGNENWGCGGTMTPEFYSNQLRRYGTFCRDYGDNKLFRIACGASGDDYTWTDVIMREWHKTPEWIQGYMQGISLHYYTVCHDWSHKGSAVNFDEADWFLSLSKTHYMETLITKHDSIMTNYDPDKKIALIVDVEPGTNPGFLYQQNTLRDALVAAINLNIFNNHSDRVKMANIAQMVNVLQSVILTKKNQVVHTPTFYVFKLYKSHHDAKLLPLEIQTENYTLNDKSIPAVTASASRNEEGIIHLSLTNAYPNKQLTVYGDLRNVSISKVKGEIITGPAINSYNDFGKSEQVTIQPFKSAKIQKNMVTVTLPSKSVVMLELN